MSTFDDYRERVLSHPLTVIVDRYRELFDLDTQSLDACIEQDYYGTDPTGWAFPDPVALYRVYALTDGEREELKSL